MFRVAVYLAGVAGGRVTEWGRHLGASGGIVLVWSETVWCFISVCHHLLTCSLQMCVCICVYRNMSRVTQGQGCDLDGTWALELAGPCLLAKSNTHTHAQLLFRMLGVEMINLLVNTRGGNEQNLFPWCCKFTLQLAFLMRQKLLLMGQKDLGYDYDLFWKSCVYGGRVQWGKI